MKFLELCCAVIKKLESSAPAFYFLPILSIYAKVTIKGSNTILTYEFGKSIKSRVFRRSLEIFKINLVISRWSWRLTLLLL